MALREHGLSDGHASEDTKADFRRAWSRWREVLPQEISLLATGKNTERQAVHHDSKTVVSSRSTRTAKDATAPVGFAVMPLTDNGTCLDVVRGSHKGHYVVENIPGSSKQCNKYAGSNELTIVAVSLPSSMPRRTPPRPARLPGVLPRLGRRRDNI